MRSSTQSGQTNTPPYELPHVTEQPLRLEPVEADTFGGLTPTTIPNP
jgi:hypothetical protein